MVKPTTVPVNEPKSEDADVNVTSPGFAPAVMVILAMVSRPGKSVVAKLAENVAEPEMSVMP